MARPILGKLKGKRPQAAAPQSAGKAETCFDVRLASKSLDNSLRNLRTDHVHVYLLHEVTTADLVGDQLHKFLEESVASGKIGTFGVGSDFGNITSLLANRREYCRVAQFQRTFMDDDIVSKDVFQIHHGLFGRKVMEFYTKLCLDNERCKAWSDELNIQLSNAECFGDLVICASMKLHPDAMLLMSSTRTERIIRNTEAVASLIDMATVQKFVELVKQNIE